MNSAPAAAVVTWASAAGFGFPHCPGLPTCRTLGGSELSVGPFIAAVSRRRVLGAVTRR